MSAFYNEIDPYAADWLRNLIKAGRIAPGIVDERDIRDIKPAELAGFTQCHFFAGIGGWSLALRLAGWPDERPVWTGSPPCQPFSAAGRRAGVADERHLWPHFYHLISQCRPPVLFGEQVSSKDGLGWFDTVQADMEAAGYACGALDICAAGVGAPHIRQRLWFVAERVSGGVQTSESSHSQGRSAAMGNQPRVLGASAATGPVSRMADADSKRREELNASVRQREDSDPETARYGSDGDDFCLDCGRNWDYCVCALPRLASCFGAGPTNGFWRAADWLHCRDGKWRPVEPGTFPLAHGLPRSVGPGSTREQRVGLVAAKANRRGRLKGYGNAIVPEVAAEVVRTYMQKESRRKAG